MTKKYNAAWDIFCASSLVTSLVLIAYNYMLWLM